MDRIRKKAMRQCIMMSCGCYLHDIQGSSKGHFDGDVENDEHIGEHAASKAQAAPKFNR